MSMMRRRLQFIALCSLLIGGTAGYSAPSQTETRVETVPPGSLPADTEVLVFGEDLERLTRKDRAAIESYSRRIDSYVASQKAKPRVFSRSVSPTLTYIWTEVTGANAAKEAARASGRAIVWSRGDKVVLIDYLHRETSQSKPNMAKFYFRPDGSLAKSRYRIEHFNKYTHAHQGQNVKNLIVVLTNFYDRSGNFIHSQDEYRDARTYRKRPEVPYGTGMGIAVYEIRRVEDFPFFNLLQQRGTRP